MTDINKNFMNIHVLISHSPSCLNRDDMNMQKSAVFGGVRRVRISSQSLKRAMRTSDAFKSSLGEPSTRTLTLGHLATIFVEKLADKFDEELVRRTMALIAGKESAEGDDKASAVAPWSLAEVEFLCSLVKEADADGLDDKKIKKLVNKQSKPLLAALAQNVDVALFGRMATSGLMTPLDGAMAVAHALTTHAVDADIDWFTAVDDLRSDEGDAGAGHLNTQEFGAGVFYRYASLNLRQLSENLGDPPQESVLSTAAHLVHLMATVVPSAKQQTFAAHNLADYVMVSFGDIPVSYANAFEEPIGRERTGGFLKPSIEALDDYANRVETAYGLEQSKAAFCTLPADKLSTVKTLPELEGWVTQGGR